ncbi:hypothetical protein CDLVIII_3879 [Clostridium sp. DL-VIII]|uniref:hypothetical protein n=1 Tax=Clostridium sp. DL-VIII TaxID=641107 RepID=UPI00023B0081|nr:hypothetical protein [Clostridium sp. DL-VIII]EHJ00424.1 hypothetical protein CDLVIII_3879 [Clostridium sp. DL-VIII]
MPYNLRDLNSINIQSFSKSHTGELSINSFKEASVVVLVFNEAININYVLWKVDNVAFAVYVIINI